MQQKRKQIFGNHLDPEEAAMWANRNLTKTCEQEEAEEAELLAAIKANSIPNEYKELYAAEIAYTTKVFLQRYPRTKKDDFEFCLHGILTAAWNSTQHPTAKKQAVMAALKDILN